MIINSFQFVSLEIPLPCLIRGFICQKNRWNDFLALWRVFYCSMGIFRSYSRTQTVNFLVFFCLSLSSLQNWLTLIDLWDERNFPREVFSTAFKKFISKRKKPVDFAILNQIFDMCNLQKSFWHWKNHHTIVVYIFFQSL